MKRITVNPVKRGRSSAKGGCFASGLISLGILLFAASMLTIVVAIGIWPGEAKLTAPFICPDDQPDAFVVTDTYQVQPGETSTNFTLYCMGPRGDFTDAGFFRSFAMLTAFHAVLIVVLVVVFGALAARRKKRRGVTVTQDAASEIPAPGAEITPDATTSQSSDSETDFEPPGPIIS